jgi:hypothetical protein
MKTSLASSFLYRAMLLLGLTLTVAACGGNDSEDDPTPVAGNELRWKINGTEYQSREAARVQAHYRGSTATGASSTDKDLLIFGDDNDHYRVSLVIMNFTGPGTYSFAPGGGSNGSLMELANNSQYYSTSYSANNPAGQVVVTDFDAAAGTVKGTFRFNGRIRNTGGSFGAALDVTDGSFNIKSMWRY